MKNHSFSSIQQLRSRGRVAPIMALIVIFACLIQTPPGMAGEAVKRRTKSAPAAAKGPIAFSKVDIHAADLSSQPNMRATGAMVDAEGQLHVLCFDPSGADIASRLQMREHASRHMISEK